MTDVDRAALVEGASLASGCGGDSPWTKKSAAVLAECIRRKLGIAFVNLEEMQEHLHDASPLRVHDLNESMASIRSALNVLDLLASRLEGL